MILLFDDHKFAQIEKKRKGGALAIHTVSSINHIRAFAIENWKLTNKILLQTYGQHERACWFQ
jgi:hypothetical protein